MDDFFYLDSENPKPLGMLNEENLPKKHSLGSNSIVRRRLSDITNLQSNIPGDKPKRVSINAKEYIQQLQSENSALRQLLQERNKLIELTGVELTKMRINLQRLQQQNRLLAQANSQMTMERTVDKDRIKVLHHELGCRGALLSVRDMKLQRVEEREGDPDGDVDKKPSNRKQKRQSRRVQSMGSSAVEEKVPTNAKDDETSKEVKDERVPAHESDDQQLSNKKSRRSRIQSPRSPTVKEQATAKEKPSNKRQSARFNSREELADEIPDSKRSPTVKEQAAAKEKPSNKRQSARFNSREELADEIPDSKRRRQIKSEPTEPTEDLFEIEDAKFPTKTGSNEKGQNAISSATNELNKQKSRWNGDTPASRTSIGRPLRKATEKVQSYKEIPVNIKMRRSE